MDDEYLKKASFDLVKSLLAGDRIQCAGLVFRYLDEEVSETELYENIIKKALDEVAELWEKNKISIATKNLATAIIESIVVELFPNLLFEKMNNKKAIVACCENEFYPAGVKRISDVFEMHGWKAYSQGIDTPMHDLLTYIRIIKPDMLAISINIYVHLTTLENTIVEVRALDPALPIMISGQAFRHGGVKLFDKYKNVLYQPDEYSVDLYIKHISASEFCKSELNV